MFSAPGTLNVQYPWHYHPFHCTVYSILSSGFWCNLSVLGFQPILGMIWEPPVWLWDSSSSSPSPGNGVDIGYTGTVSPTVDWAESSCPPLVCDGMMHCPLLACQLCCKCCTFTAVLFLRESDFCMAFCVGHWPGDMC